MPNWCSNSLTIKKATPEQIQRIVAACEKQSLLNEFYPEPDWASIPNENGHIPGPKYKSRWLRTATHDGKQIWRSVSHVDNRRFPNGEADQRWYDWRTQQDNWSTKWEPDVEVTHTEGDCIDIYFDSAWCPPGDAWFAKLSEAMPNAEIVNTFEEPGCDFFGMQYATKGVCTSRCLDISSLFDPWVIKQLSPKDLVIYKDENHPHHEEVVDNIRDVWYDNAPEVIEEALVPVLTQLQQWATA